MNPCIIHRAFLSNNRSVSSDTEQYERDSKYHFSFLLPVLQFLFFFFLVRVEKENSKNKKELGKKSHYINKSFTKSWKIDTKTTSKLKKNYPRWNNKTYNKKKKIKKSEKRHWIKLFPAMLEFLDVVRLLNIVFY